MSNFIKDILKKIIARQLCLTNEEVDWLLRKQAYLSKKRTEYQLMPLLSRLRPIKDADMELIRLGPPGDGGYLVPNDLDGVEACFSPGVGKVSSFEKDCAARGMKVFMADKSVNNPKESDPLFEFTRRYVGAITDQEYITIEDWVNESLISNAGELLLQIDIEGAEYETFYAVPQGLMERFRIIVAEFHLLGSLWDKNFARLATRVFDKILMTHACVHIHPNNCCGTTKRGHVEIPNLAEFTFLRRDRLKSPIPVKQFPHPLDADNDCDKPSLPLPICWYS